MKPARPLRPEEKKLIKQLLHVAAGSARLQAALATSQVQEIESDGMGSLRFVQIPDDGARRSASVVAEAQGVDQDGVPVSIALNVDQRGHLYELDIWKADFSPLRAFPKLVTEGTSSQ